MPKITTYTNNSDEHVLDKSIVKISENVDVEFKENTNMVNPVIILSNSLSVAFNYCYINTFDRYYFVRNITYSQQRYFIDLEVDVLMSFNTEIKSLNVIANRSSSLYNTYQKDDSIPFLNKNKVATQPFPSGFAGNSIILAVNGD